MYLRDDVFSFGPTWLAEKSQYPVSLDGSITIELSGIK